MLRTLLAAAAALLLLGTFCNSPARAAAASQPSTSDPDIQKAVDAGVRYLVSKQNPDGSICNDQTEQTAMTAFAVMALRGAGVRPAQQTPPAAAMRKALAWLLQDARLRPDGYFGTDGSWMYTHGYVTLMLAQMAGNGVDAQQNALIKSRLKKAVDLILAAQKKNPTGGWRYQSFSVDADIGVTSCQVRALAAARQAGIDVPKEAFNRAADFIKNCAGDEGGFSYVPGNPVGWSRSALGLLALQLCGQGDCPEARLAVQYLQARPVPADRLWYLYACPAYVAAMGAAGPDALADARDNVADTVLKFQHPDGSWTGWSGDNYHGQVFCTSLVILSLTAKPAEP